MILGCMADLNIARVAVTVALRSWDTSRATKYDAAANKIYIAGVGPDALKGLVSIDFHYIRLVSNNGPAEGKDAQAFDKLLHDQVRWAAVPASPPTSRTTNAR